MKSDDTLRVQGNFTILSPDQQSDTALIFYPGAKVEHTAYLPILEKLRQNAITCVLIKMPFNMAIFDSNAADKLFEELPNIKNWYIGGHSMGGAMASSYAANHKDKVKGLILLGAYIYGDVSPQDTLTIYGTLKKVALFASCSGGSAEKYFALLNKEISDCTVLSTLRLIEPVKNTDPEDKKRIVDFCTKLKLDLVK